MEYAPVSALMGRDSKRWPGLYRRYVESSMAETDRDFLEAYRVSPRCIGGSDFVSHVNEMYRDVSDSYTSPEDVTFRRVVEPVNPESVFSVIEDVFEIEKRDLLMQRRDSPLRGIAAGFFLKYSGLTQRQIAHQLNVKSGSTISKQIVRSRKLVAQQGELRCQVKKCEKVLREMRRAEQLLND